MRLYLAGLLLAAATSSLTPSASAQEKSSKEPPAGAPWVQDFAEARARALAENKPIFLYSTKTY